MQLDPDPHLSEKLDPDPQYSQIQELTRLKMEPWRLKMEAPRVCRPVVADSRHLDEDPDP